MAVLAVFFVGVVVTLAVVGIMLRRAANEEKERQQAAIAQQTAFVVNLRRTLQRSVGLLGGMRRTYCLNREAEWRRAYTLRAWNY